MYLEACLQRRRHFLPFIASVDGILGVDARDALNRIAGSLTKKCQQPYSRMCRYVKSSISITFVRATHSCIRGAKVLAHGISVMRSQWDDGAGLNLFQ